MSMLELKVIGLSVVSGTDGGSGGIRIGKTIIFASREKIDRAISQQLSCCTKIYNNALQT